ncbi:hypothetical protein Scep_022549 [Stephania cephalantha]|uniref:Endonuclease/exonuclease/phosphatase domain-containing protein n=1 Tax=Stephania cephalantha TaxID=152367 RepID=A0AAP0I2C4_9MAGN
MKIRSAAATDSPAPPHKAADHSLSAAAPRKRKRDRNPKKSKKGEQIKPKKLGLRKWVWSPKDCSRFEDKFVVVSYNILGVENALKHPDLYDGVPPRFLEWERRRRLIRKEIKRYSPSILCFQEVDRFFDLAEVLKEDGFGGVYKARTGDACDGCAIFWKEEKFTLLHQESIEFNQFDLRNNVAQFCILKMNVNHSSTDGNPHSSLSLPTRSIIVGNTHMLFNPNRGDIKLGQIRLFVERAYKLSKEWGDIPVVISGDFNSTPKSAIYQYLASSELNLLLHDRRRISGQVDCSSSCRTFTASTVNVNRSLTFRWNEEELYLAAGSIVDTHLYHKLRLSSAYAGVPGNFKTRDGDGEPLATSYHSKFMGTVDYIWHSKELVPVRVVETLPIDNLRKTGGLPSKKWGSDHLSLVCELAFSDDGTMT